VLLVFVFVSISWILAYLVFLFIVDSFITFFQYSSGFFWYNWIFSCMFCVILFNFVNYFILLLCYIFLLLCYVFLLLCYAFFCWPSYCNVCSACVFCLIVLLCVLFVYECVLDCYSRVSTRLQLNKSYETSRNAQKLLTSELVVIVNIYWHHISGKS
jgi:hypothetical protein